MSPPSSKIGLRRSAETRFQGIATFQLLPHDAVGVKVGVPRPVFRGLRPDPSLPPFLKIFTSECRDPFSGDCDKTSPVFHTDEVP